MYGKIWKRVLDFALSLLSLLLLSPLFTVLAAVGAVAMRGNPFFAQERPGKDERIFRLVKFRTVSNARDARGSRFPMPIGSTATDGFYAASVSRKI